MMSARRSRRQRRPEDGTVGKGDERSRLNQTLLWLIIALLATSPIPLGGTPPITWAIWGSLIGLVTFGYVVLLGRAGRKASVGLGSLGVATALHFIFCVYLVVQMLPIGRLVGGFPLPLSDGSTTSLDTISVAPGDTLMMLIRMLSFAMLFYLTTQVAINDRRRQTLMRAIVIIVVIQALYALVALFQLGDTVLGVPKWKYFGSATGSFLNRNNFATYMIFGMVTAIALAAAKVFRWHDGHVRFQLSSVAMMYLVAVVILISTITLTNSRMGFALSWVGLGLMLLLVMARTAKSLRAFVIALPLMLVAAGVLFFTYGQSLWARFEYADTSFDFRLGLYQQVIKLIELRPWTGFGGGTFGQAFPIVHEAGLNPTLFWDKAHDTYLALWSETGLIFGSIPMVLVALMAGRLIFNLAKGRGSWTSQAPALVAVSVGALHSLVDFSLEIEAVTFLFVVAGAIGFAGTKVQTRDL